MVDPDSTAVDSQRRKLLVALASGGALSLAGCGGQDGAGTPAGTTNGDGSSTDTMGGGDTPDEGTPTQTVAKQTTVAEGTEAQDPNFNWAFKSSWNPVEANVNPESPNVNSPWFIHGIWGGLDIQANLRGTPVYMMAESFEMADDNRSAVVTYKDGYTWWDGTPLRAKDVTAPEKVFNFQTFYQETNPNTQIEVLNEQPPKLRYKYSCKRNPTLALLDLRFQPIFPRWEWYKPWLDKYRDAGGESAINTVTKDLGEATMSIQEAVDEGYGIGLWKPTDWNTQRVVHEKYEDHPRAGDTNLQKFTLELLESNQKLTQAVSNGEVDAGDVGSISGASVPNDAMAVNHRVPTGAQIGLKLRKANKHLAKPRVRRAMAYAINHEDILKALKKGLGVNAKYGGTQNMASSQIENNFLPESARNAMIDYGRTAQLDKATQLMKAAGYTKQGGVWRDEAGDAVNLTHITPTWNKYKFISNYLSEKLGNFGIQTEVQALSYSGLQNKWQNTFEFDMMTWFQQGLHPARWYSLGRNGKGWLELNGWGLSMLANPDKQVGCKPVERAIKEGKAVDDRLQQPIRPEYPAQVGTRTLDLDGVSETKTLKPFVLTTRMEQATSKERLMELTKEFAWYANWSCVNLELFDEVFTHFGNTEKFAYPNPDTDAYYMRDLWIWMAKGMIDGKSA